MANKANAYRASTSKVTKIHDEILEAAAQAKEKKRLIEQRKRAIQTGMINTDGRMDHEVNLDVQLRIEQMTMFKKAKDRKVMQNNPPKKETHLKESKDNKVAV